MQSQPLRGWKLGRITSNGVPRPKSIRAISAVESMEVGTLSLQLGSQVPSHLRSTFQSQPLRVWKSGRITSNGVPSHLRSICAISAVERMEVGTYHFKWGPKAQVNSCNLSR